MTIVVNFHWVITNQGTELRAKEWLTCGEDLWEMKDLYKKKRRCYSGVMILRFHQLIGSVFEETILVMRIPRLRSQRAVLDWERLWKKMSQVEEFYNNLREKHGEPEQFRAWANMIQLGKHSPLDNPPSSRFFKSPNHSQKTKVPQSECSTAARDDTPITGKSPQDPTALSPSKKATFRSQCIEQLERCYNLMNSGHITKEQYDDLQASILRELKLSWLCSISYYSIIAGS